MTFDELKTRYEAAQLRRKIRLCWKLAKRKEKQLVSHSAKLGEDGWRTITIRLVILAAFLYIGAFLYVFCLGAEVVCNGSNTYTFGADERARAVTPFLVGFAGFVTLAATLWRGSISQRQVDVQQHQNDSRDEADLGLLLEKAGLMLGPEAKVFERSVALAMLETVALARNDHYAQFALELTFEQWIWSYGAVEIREITETKVPTVVWSPGAEDATETDEADRDRLRPQIRKVLDRAKDEKQRVLSDQRIIGPSIADRMLGDRISVQMYASLPEVQLNDAHVVLNDDAVQAFNQGKQWFFRGCQIMLSGIGNQKALYGLDHRICCSIISNVRIASVGESEYGGTPRKNSFNNCDFSGATFASKACLTENTFHQCRYAATRPPRFENPRDGDLVAFIEAEDIEIISHAEIVPDTE